jgi:hypothetical protein
VLLLLQQFVLSYVSGNEDQILKRRLLIRSVLNNTRREISTNKTPQNTLKTAEQYGVEGKG